MRWGRGMGRRYFPASGLVGLGSVAALPSAGSGAELWSKNKTIFVHFLSEKPPFANRIY